MSGLLRRVPVDPRGDPGAGAGHHPAHAAAAPQAGDAGLDPEVALILALGIVSIPVLGRITRASTLSWSRARVRARGAARRARRTVASSGARCCRTCCRRCCRSRCSASRSPSSPRARSASSGRACEADTPTWGNMIAGGRQVIALAPHVVFEPALMIFFTVLVAEPPRRRRPRALRRAGSRAVSAIRPGPEAPGGATPLLEVRDVATWFDTDRGLGARGRRRVVHPRARPHRSASWASRARARPCSSRSIMGLLPKSGVRAPGLDPVRGGGDRIGVARGRCASTGARTSAWCSRTR